MENAIPNCLRLLWQAALRAASRACAKTGKRMAARMAMMAMTTSSSISVNPRRGRQRFIFIEKPLDRGRKRAYDGIVNRFTAACQRAARPSGGQAHAAEAHA